ncbi:MAG: amino acid adenylation domain-containing protein [bacterium]|nr:amino acid adenylation domain-containing protein [bacterium]
MNKIKDFKLFDSEPVVLENRVQPVNPFTLYEKADINQSVASRFEQQVEKYPGNIAVKTFRKEYTYRQLNTLSNHIAHSVSSPDQRCGAALLFEHDADMIPGIIAALKAGKFYVPLDPTYPIERLAYILEDSGADVVITNQSNHLLALKLTRFSRSPIRLIDIDELKPGLPDENPSLDISPHDFAYILYTSGSTGRPKGVIQDQRNVLHFARVYINALHIHSGDRLTQFSSYGFDAAQMDIYGALLSGGTLYPYDLKQEGGLHRFNQWLKEEKITLFHSIPTVYRYFVDTLTNEDAFPELRFIVLGGEAVYRRDIENYKKHFSPQCLFINGLGPTESTVTLQYFVNRETQITKEAVPVGYAVDETEVFLLNLMDRETRRYEPGEIVFKSDYLAVGYLNNVVKTHQVFGPDPLTGSGRTYRTGDMGRRLPDGSIEFIGRNDSQVKVNGYRIELGEIEGNLDNIDGVQKSVVVCKQDRGGENYLAAYYVSDEDAQVDANVLIRHLKMILPDYLTPRVFIHLQEFPLTLTGKVDRNALPESEEGGEHAYVPPANQHEEKVVAIWAEVLQMETQEISMDSNFFEIGGQSFKAVILAAKVQKEFDVNIPLQDMFDLSTARDMAHYLKKDAREDTFIPIEPVGEKENYPLSSAQKRLYIMYRMDEKSTRYNVSSAVVLRGPLDIRRLKDTFLQLIRRHESLRTSFATLNDEPVQVIHNVEDLSFDIPRHESADIEPGAEVNRLVRPFDLEKPPLFRVDLVKREEEKHVLVVDIHHIVTDGTSKTILINDFITLYNGKELTPLILQYRDFSHWQNRLLETGEIQKQEEYWTRRFEGEIPVLNNLTDFPRPGTYSSEGDGAGFKIEKELSDKLGEMVKETGATLYMVLLAVYYVLLSRYTGEEDIVVGTGIAGRRHADLEGIIGLFVNMLALRNYPGENKTFDEFLREVKTNALDAYQNQDYQFDQLVTRLGIRGDSSRTPLFDTQFTFQNMNTRGPAEGMSGLTLEPYGYRKETVQFDLSLNGVETPGQIYMKFSYMTALFKRDSVEKLGKYFVEVVKQVTENRHIMIKEIKVSHTLAAGKPGVDKKEEALAFGF